MSALPAALRRVVARIVAGEAVDAVLAEADATLRRAGFAPDYIALVEAATLRPLSAVAPGSRLIAAARLGQVRLLDNLPVG